MSKLFDIAQSDNWFAGEDKSLRFLIVDEDDAPLDVSSYALRWVLEGLSGTDLLTKETGDGITVGDGNGTGDAVTVAIDAEDTADIYPGVYRHALRRTDDDNEQVLSYGDAHLRDAAAVDA